MQGAGVLKDGKGFIPIAPFTLVGKVGIHCGGTERLPGGSGVLADP